MKEADVEVQACGACGQGNVRGPTLGQAGIEEQWGLGAESVPFPSLLGEGGQHAKRDLGEAKDEFLPLAEQTEFEERSGRCVRTRSLPGGPQSVTTRGVSRPVTQGGRSQDPVAAPTDRTGHILHVTPIDLLTDAKPSL